MNAEISRFLDAEMERALADARASGWTQEGQIIMVRQRMKAAYVEAQKMAEHDA